jgi:hypothetical protein
MNTTARVVSPGKVVFHASIESGLMVFKIYHGSWYFGRPSIDELRQELRLRAVSRKCRPDWDIATPEMNAAWEWGEKDRLGKSYAKVFREQE